MIPFWSNGQRAMCAFDRAVCACTSIGYTIRTSYCYDSISFDSRSAPVCLHFVWLTEQPHWSWNTGMTEPHDSHSLCSGVGGRVLGYWVFLGCIFPGIATRYFLPHPTCVMHPYQKTWQGLYLWSSVQRIQPVLLANLEVMLHLTSQECLCEATRW